MSAQGGGGGGGGGGSRVGGVGTSGGASAGTGAGAASSNGFTSGMTRGSSGLSVSASTPPLTSSASMRGLGAAAAAAAAADTKLTSGAAPPPLSLRAQSARVLASSNSTPGAVSCAPSGSAAAAAVVAAVNAAAQRGASGGGPPRTSSSGAAAAARTAPSGPVGPNQAGASASSAGGGGGSGGGAGPSSEHLPAPQGLMMSRSVPSAPLPAPHRMHSPATSTTPGSSAHGTPGTPTTLHAGGGGGSGGGGSGAETVAAATAAAVAAAVAAAAAGPAPRGEGGAGHRPPLAPATASARAVLGSSGGGASSASGGGGGGSGGGGLPPRPGHGSGGGAATTSAKQLLSGSTAGSAPASAPASAVLASKPAVTPVAVPTVTSSAAPAPHTATNSKANAPPQTPLNLHHGSASTPASPSLRAAAAAAIASASNTGTASPRPTSPPTPPNHHPYHNDPNSATSSAAPVPRSTHGTAAAALEASLSRAGLVAVVDLTVALYKFVNIELHSQGWYAVRVRVVHSPDVTCVVHTVVQQTPPAPAAGGAAAAGGGVVGGGAAAAAVGAGGGGCGAAPGGHDRASPVSGGGVDAAAVKRQGWVVDEAACSFRSAVFRVRYCYEEVKLQTAVQMRLFLSNLQALPNMDVTLEFELLFQEANLDNPAAVPEEFHLRSVARESVTLAGCSAGLAHFYGCTFSDEQFGLCAAGLFSQLAGFAPREALDGLRQRPNGSNWLCHFAGDGRRGAPDRGNDAGPSLLGGGATAQVVRVSTSRAADTVDFSDQELRKKVIRILHSVLEAPSVKHGAQAIPTEAERHERMLAAFSLLVETHKRSRDRVAAALRLAPPECYSPQTLEVLRKLLAGQHGPGAAAGVGQQGSGSAPSTPPRWPAAGGGGGGGGPAPQAPASPLRGGTPRASQQLAKIGGAGGAGGGAAAGAAATGEGPVAVPSLGQFRLALQQHPTTAAALAQLDGLLVGLSRDARTDWSVLGWVLRTAPRELMRHLKLLWEGEQPDAVLPFIVWDVAAGRDAIAARAAQHRLDLRAQRFPLPAVQTSSLWGSPGDQPVLLIDDSQGVKWLQESEQHFDANFRPRDETHVAIFVHGFQGAATDLCLVKAHLMLMYPYLECFSSKTNEGNTHDSLQEMGKRLAVEMAEVLAPFARSTRRPLRKITLVGHSIGNLILRAALTQPEVEPYKHLLWLYLSVSGPHLGFLYGTNAVVDTGLMLLKSIGKGKCLHQLTFSDAPQLTDCYLYRLAHESPLSVFKLVVVVSSPQDRYVPYHSSSIGSCPQAERDSRRGRCYNDMMRALTAGVGQGTHLFRLSVDFSLRSKSFSFSKLVGRTAHIEFIESQLYVGLMMWGLVHRYTMLAPSPHSWL